MSLQRILFLDDEALLPHHEWDKVLVQPLARSGFAVDLEENPAVLPERLAQGCAAVLLDLKFGRDPRFGFRLLKEAKRLRPECPVLMLTVSSGVAVDLQCHAAGADGYQSKADLDAELLAELLHLLIHQVPGCHLLLGGSAHARALRQAIRLARSCDSTVLITGETGTGKELVARGVHLLGPRWRPEVRFGNFVPVNCPGVPESLWESEMFGHRRGAATGLTATHCGSFLAAGGYGAAGEPRRDSEAVRLARTGPPGTLFLDELGELPLPLQAKLLRAVQERRVRLVGDPREYPVDDRLDVRLLAATNRDLRAEMAAGTFRTDLYYRLNVLPIHVPPLRERREDIGVLAAAFVKARTPSATLVRDIADDALDQLQRHSWPGNVRELENALERSLVRLRFEGGDVLRARHLDLEAPGPAAGLANLRRAVAEAIVGGAIEPESFNPRPDGGDPTFGTLVYRAVAELLRARGELSQKHLAEVWHLEPGSIGPLNSACGVHVRRSSEP
jgi:two-component system response regulator PilR (NtrC family)